MNSNKSSFLFNSYSSPLAYAWPTVGAIALKTGKFDFGSICGLLCGAMANPMALSYANDTIKNDRAAVAYTSVYPLGMFIRVIIAQIIIMFIV